MSHAITRVLALLALAPLVLFGCGGSDSQSDGGGGPGADPAAMNGKPVRGDWLVRSMLADPQNLNPLTSSDAGSARVLDGIFSSLLTSENERIAPRPLLAAALPEISEDRLTYTFRLREDVTFSDGHALLAEDVLFAMKATKHPQVEAPFSRNYYESVRDVIALDDYTVRFELRRPYFLNTWILGAVAPLPRHHYDPENLLRDISVAELDAYDELDRERKERAGRFAKHFNEDFLYRPLGPGPLVLRDPEKDVLTGEQIVLHRRADYWGADDPALADFFFDRVVFRIINDVEAQLVSLKNGEIDLSSMTPLQFRNHRSNELFHEKIATQQNYSPGYSYIGWNQQRPIFADRRVRRALSHFVDKQNLVDKILHGLGVPIESPVYFEYPEHHGELASWPFDPKRGRALLAEAGWSDTDGDGILDKELDGKRVPLRFEIISNSGNPIRKKVGLAVTDQLKRAGIAASYRQLDWSIMLEMVQKRRDYDAVILGWSAPRRPPDLYQVWHSSQNVIGGSNYVAFENEEADAILEEYRVEFDPARRKALYDRLQVILYDEQPYTFLFTQKVTTAWDRRFHGVSWYPLGRTDLHEWFVPASLQRY